MSYSQIFAPIYSCNTWSFRGLTISSPISFLESQSLLAPDPFHVPKSVARDQLGHLLSVDSFQICFWQCKLLLESTRLALTPTNAVEQHLHKMCKLILQLWTTFTLCAATKRQPTKLKLDFREGSMIRNGNSKINNRQKGTTFAIMNCLRNLNVCRQKSRMFVAL